MSQLQHTTAGGLDTCGSEKVNQSGWWQHQVALKKKKAGGNVWEYNGALEGGPHFKFWLPKVRDAKSKKSNPGPSLESSFHDGESNAPYFQTVPPCSSLVPAYFCYSLRNSQKLVK